MITSVLSVGLLVSIGFNLFFWRKWDDSELQVLEECNAKWIALKRANELEARLLPFKAYEDQVSQPPSLVVRYYGDKP